MAALGCCWSLSLTYWGAPCSRELGASPLAPLHLTLSECGWKTQPPARHPAPCSEKEPRSEGPPAWPVSAIIFKEMNPQEKKLSPTTEHSTVTLPIITVATVYSEPTGRSLGPVCSRS